MTSEVAILFLQAGVGKGEHSSLEVRFSHQTSSMDEKEATGKPSLIRLRGSKLVEASSLISLIGRHRKSTSKESSRLWHLHSEPVGVWLETAIHLLIATFSVALTLDRARWAPEASCVFIKFPFAIYTS